MNKVVIATLSASVASGVTFFLTKRYYTKQMDILAQSTTEEVQSMHSQLTEVHRVFVEEQPIEIADSRQKTWDAIANATNSVVGKTDEEVVKEFRSGILNARKGDEYTMGGDISSEYRSETPVTNEATLVVSTPETVGNNIFQITELEFMDNNSAHTKEELNLWLVEEGLYDEHESPIDGCKGLIGMTIEELMDIADTHDYSHLYFRNENTNSDYCINVHKDGYSDYFQSISG